MKKAVFLDRDGVLNQTIFRMGKPRAPYTLEEFKLFPGVTEAIELLKKSGFILVVVTNQPDVARGWVSRESVDMMNSEVIRILKVDSLKVCFHTEKDHCHCRKPKPGMLLEATKEFNIDLSSSYMIGDRISDVQAGKNAECTTILVGSDETSLTPAPDLRVQSLLEAAQWIISR